MNTLGTPVGSMAMMVADGKNNPFTMSMTSRQIAEVANKEHRNVIRDIRVLIETGAMGPLNFEQTSYIHPQNGQEYPEYILDFEATLLLITGYDVFRRKAVLKRWSELEQGLATPAYQIPQTYAEALRLAAEQTAKVEQQQALIEDQNNVIKEIKPKADLYDIMFDAGQDISLWDFGQVLANKYGKLLGPKRIFKFLREEGIIREDKSLPFSRHQQEGYFKVKLVKQNVQTFKVTFVTPKGQTMIRDLVVKEFGS